MLAFDSLFDFNGDGRLDMFERAVQFQVMDRGNRGTDAGGRVDSGLTGFADNDDVDVFTDAGLDYEELEFMDPTERRGVLVQAGLDPDQFDF